MRSIVAGPPDRGSDPDAAVRVAAVLVRDDLVDPLGRPLDLAGLVRDDVVVVVLPGQLDRGVRAGAARARRRVSVARARSRWNSSSSDGGTTKIRSASVTCSLTTWAPWTSIFRITSRPATRASRTWSRGEPYQLPWTSFASRKPAFGADPEELVAAEEVVVDAVDLAVARRAGRAGHDVVAVAIAAGLALAAAERVDDRVLARRPTARR